MHSIKSLFYVLLCFVLFILIWDNLQLRKNIYDLEKETRRQKVTISEYIEINNILTKQLDDQIKLKFSLKHKTKK